MLIIMMITKVIGIGIPLLNNSTDDGDIDDCMHDNDKHDDE